MASSHFGACTSATSGAAVPHRRKTKHQLLFSIEQAKFTGGSRGRIVRSSRIRVSDGGDSYLDMWNKAVDRERKEVEFRKIVENSVGADAGSGGDEVEASPEVLEKKSSEFQKILEVSQEERNRIQRMQVIDRAAAAIAAARAILKETSLPKPISGDSAPLGTDISKGEAGEGLGAKPEGMQSGSSSFSQLETLKNEAPGPDFWSWTPPLDSGRSSDDESNLKSAKKTSSLPTETNPVMEKERSTDSLSIPFESKLFESYRSPSLPPLQSLTEVEKVEVSTSSLETPILEEKHELGVLFSAHAADAVHALEKVDEPSSKGVYPDGSRWWKETGIEQRPDGVVCHWTMTRGVSADQTVEWEEKYWEAADQFDHKELGSEKSGRDAAGNVWREFWKESMFQEHGLAHIEKTADKWGKNEIGNEWHEKWWEHYDASGQAEKWAHKWCSIDPETHLEVGHAHVWHERWGEKYDGLGGSTKYTDKWAERCEGDGWTKWGDKWDENFDLNGQGVKQGETWWQGKYGQRWNRTWGEGHNGSGWVHKYGKSSCGEHWDTHIPQETWYERFPHFGFQHCFDNSVQLREVKKPSETSRDIENSVELPEVHKPSETSQDIENSVQLPDVHKPSETSRDMEDAF